MPKYKINWSDDSTAKSKAAKLNDFGLLMMRILASMMMMFGHGFDKLVNFSEYASKFADPFGLGPALSLGLAVFAEFFCSIAVMFGFMTRYSVIPLIITMLTAAFIIHSDDPWGKKEFALVYMIPFLTLLFTGAGRYSVDAKLFGKRRDS